ncbi:MAG TPA: hypothetical protein VF605_18030 [Allosphingosinicella sp.]|jgi:hypothetical protein
MAALMAAALAAACAESGPVKAEADVRRDSGGGQRTCSDIRGYLNDEAAPGRAVHSEPDSASAVLGRIAPPSRSPAGDYEVPVGFDILASRDGWLLVEGAADDAALTEQPARTMYSGRGWIRSERVAVGLQTRQAFAEPRHSSALLIEANEPNSLADLFEIAACDGQWVLGRWRPADPSTVRYERAAVVSADPLILEAWATGICNIQETSCDGVSGDRPAAPAK